MAPLEVFKSWRVTGFLAGCRHEGNHECGTRTQAAGGRLSMHQSRPSISRAKVREGQGGVADLVGQVRGSDSKSPLTDCQVPGAHSPGCPLV